MLTLKSVKAGETFRVLKVGGKGPIKRRIMEMGITRGAEITVRKTAPLGDPIEVTVRGYELSLRRVDAELIEVEKFELISNSVGLFGSEDHKRKSSEPKRIV